MDPLQSKKWKNILRDKEFISQCERNGVDLSLLSRSLAMTPTERVKRNRDLIDILEEARKNHPKKNLNAVS